ncbi:MAG: PAS domain S-box protein, partial [Deltaproteobacteria bacterium]|nr:PAS domain S-box protein [Deltaproteobacteria bacterium]
MKQTDSKSGYFQRFQTFAMNRMIPSSIQERDSLSYWRVRILFSIIFTGLLIGIIVFVPVIAMVIKEQFWGLLIFDLSAWLIGVGLLLMRGLRYDIRAGITLFMLYFIGLVLIVSVGPLSGGPVWLFTFAVLVGVLLGSKAAITALIINALTLTVIGWSIGTGLFGHTFPFFSSTERMIVTCVNFIFLNAVAAMSVSVLVKGLVSTHQKEKDLISTLQREQLRLVEIKNELEPEVEERKQAEQALRESEERYQVVAEDSPGLICSFLPGGEITFVNKAYCEYFDKAFKELAGSNFLLLIPEADRRTVMDDISMLSVESPTQSQEHQVIAPNG